MSTPQQPQQPLDLEIEVPGTPEQVWQAIATGPGISSWLHPTTVEEREGGTFTFDMGMGPQSGTVTAWDPPRRFAEETTWGGREGMPATTLATEWLVAARSGSSCVVRMVTSGFGAGGDWADEFDGFAESMQTSLANLRLYLAHFAGQTGIWVKAYLPGSGDRHRTWSQLIDALGLADASVGDRVATAGPGFTGTVEHAAEGRWRRDLLLRLEQPAPGLAGISVWGEAAMVLVQAVLFGDGAEAVAAEQAPAWRKWLAAHIGAEAQAEVAEST